MISKPFFSIFGLSLCILFAACGDTKRTESRVNSVSGTYEERKQSSESETFTTPPSRTSEAGRRTTRARDERSPAGAPAPDRRARFPAADAGRRAWPAATRRALSKPRARHASLQSRDLTRSIPWPGHFRTVPAPPPANSRRPRDLSAPRSRFLTAQAPGAIRSPTPAPRASRSSRACLPTLS